MPNREKVKEVCDTFLDAKLRGEIDQKTLTYELSKLTAEIIDDYKPLSMPTKPELLRHYDAVPKDIRTKLTPEEMEDVKNKTKQWREQCCHIDAQNMSNLEWLKECEKSLRENNHPGAHKIKEMIYSYEVTE